ncbi:MAG: HEAT repeat domain-containing protein, partial [Planctomycetales bacterium]|nr:HEAT repeat domain-containing protein [Planctomycetales bacterium]
KSVRGLTPAGSPNANDEGSSLGATEVEPIVFSSDANFRPGDIEVGPDGAIYFTDWQNPIIGHMQHNLRDPSRDHDHGRVYRVTYVGRELVKPKPIAGQSTSDVLKLLADPDDRVRYRARLELSGRDSKEVFADIDQFLFIASNNVTSILKDIANGTVAGEHRARLIEEVSRAELELLWVHQHHNKINVPLLERVLNAPDFRARAAAVRVIAAWHDRLPNALDLLRRAAADESPRVRLMALWAASFIPSPEAAEVVLIANEQPTDLHLEFLSKEVMRTLQPLMDKAKADGKQLAFKSEAGARFLLKGISNDDLLKQKRDRLVLTEMLYRPGLRDEHRREAVRELAKLDNKPELRVIMDTILALDGKAANVDTTVVFDLVRQLTSRRAAELTSARAELEKLATSAKQPIFRQIGYVSLINVDDNVAPAWKLATTNANRLIDFVNAMPLISDPNIRATLYEKVEPLLHELPPELSSPKDRGTVGRFVRVEIPGKATLTLSEVEVFSGGNNIARKGRASQKNTAHGGDAAKAIDGGTGGIYGSGNLTHTEENTGNPWWEVDLGEEVPLDSIVIWNRTDGDLGERLNNFTLKILDTGRAEVWKQEKNPAPKRNVTIELSGGGKGTLVRQAAMNALTHVRGQESKTFTTLAKFVKDNVDRVAAIRAIQRLPRNAWPKDEADPLLTVLLDHIKKTPAKDRTQPAALDAFEFADALTTLIPADRAKKIRAELGELGVKVIKIGTIFEKMSFDKDVIAVEKGKPIEFLFDNSDLMPHNLVIAQPGSLEEIGLASEASAQQPGFAEKQYIPDSPKIILKSRLLQPRDNQRLSFTAPTKPGVYPIVCTYPGHWRRMYSALYVVDDLDEYQANPEAYLAASKLEAKDPLLKDRRPRTEWKIEDLADAVLHMEHEAGRSYSHGKQMFTVASCIGCHKLEGVGREFGADLSKLDPKYKPLDILKEIMDPSANINEKYQANTIELSSGKVVTGLVIEESGDVIKLVENPLVKADPIIIKRGDVIERVKSKTSIMPKGLLDKLTKDEILDLIAYLSARGDKNHAVFKGGHDHAGH